MRIRFASSSEARRSASAEATFCICSVRKRSSSAFCFSTACSRSFFCSMALVMKGGRLMSRISTAEIVIPYGPRYAERPSKRASWSCAWVASRKKSSARGIFLPCSRSSERSFGTRCTLMASAALPTFLSSSDAMARSIRYWTLSSTWVWSWSWVGTAADSLWVFCRASKKYQL